MLQLTSLYNGPAVATDILELDFAGRCKSRQCARLRSGEPVAVWLPSGTLLRGGQRLEASDGRIVAVVAASEALLEARYDGATALARAAYHLGNRHVVVQLGAGWLRLYPDHVLEGMLRGLGAQLRQVRAAFEPEAGAYAQGQRHAHAHAGEPHSSGAHTHGSNGGTAKIHMMGEEVGTGA